MKDGDTFHRTRDGLLPVECWCRCAIVRVSPTEIRQGRTESCGREWCKPVA